MREEFAVHVATNGRDAEDFISTSSPTDIVITNLMLPYVNGFELITLIRENPLWRNVPVIAVNALFICGHSVLRVAACSFDWLESLVWARGVHRSMDDINDNSCSIKFARTFTFAVALRCG